MIRGKNPIASMSGCDVGEFISHETGPDKPNTIMPSNTPLTIFTTKRVLRCTGATVFRPRLVDGLYQAAIWNGRQGAAYFSSPTPFTAAQMAAIDRVALFQEGEDPGKCNLRTVFSWE
jgi:hypothetical protein